MLRIERLSEAFPAGAVAVNQLKSSWINHALSLAARH
jgi:hypothetical protein